jgi:hypothetical protein
MSRSLALPKTPCLLPVIFSLHESVDPVRPVLGNLAEDVATKATGFLLCVVLVATPERSLIIESAVLAWILGAILLVKDKVPVLCQMLIIQERGQKLPSIGEVGNEAVDDGSVQTEADIGPAHSRAFSAVNLKFC